MSNTTTIPTAAEARALIDTSKSEKAKIEWANISTSICMAIKRGDDHISYSSLLEVNKGRLDKLGYRIEYKQCGMNEYEWEISW